MVPQVPEGLRGASPALPARTVVGDFVPTLEQSIGGTAGLSPATLTRLTRQWQDDHAAFQQRDLSDRDFVYVWADGVHPKVRLGQAHSCVLVLLGVRLDGTKELIALAEALRQSTESWSDLLHDCRRRGMRDPELVIGRRRDGPVEGPVRARRVRPGTLARDHRSSPGHPGPLSAKFENGVLAERSERIAA